MHVRDLAEDSHLVLHRLAQALQGQGKVKSGPEEVLSGKDPVI